MPYSVPVNNFFRTVRMATRQGAINEKCKDCIYDPKAGGNWRQQTSACTIKSCALWPFRPKSKPKKAVLQGAEGASHG